MLSDRIQAVPGSETVAISDSVKRKRAAGDDVVDLSVGEPDFPTPTPVVKAAEKALHDGHTHYGPSAGIPELREAIVERQIQRRGTECAIQNTLVTPAKHALLTFFLCTLDPGDEVILPTPAWVSYEPQIRLCGGTATHVLTQAGRINPDDIKEALTPDTKAIVLNSPANPTGTVQPEATIKALLDIAQDEDVWIVSDEVYGELTYGDHAALSPARIQGSLDNVAIVDGVSKAYAMTGWRIGWLLGPRTLIQSALKVQQHSITHPTLFAQYGAAEALGGDQSQLERMRTAFKQRRDYVADRLDDLGATCPALDGAFYAFPRFPDIEDGHAFAQRLLETQGVAVTPGEAFGTGGEGHVRLSYAASQGDLETAFDRIEDALEQ